MVKLTQNDLHSSFSVESAFHVTTEDIEKMDDRFNNILKEKEIGEEKRAIFENCVSWCLPNLKVNKEENMILNEIDKFRPGELPVFYATIAKRAITATPKKGNEIINRNLKGFINCLAKKREEDEFLKVIFHEFSEISNISKKKNIDEESNRKIFEAFINCVCREVKFNQLQETEVSKSLNESDNNMNAKAGFIIDAERVNNGESFGIIEKDEGGTKLTFNHIDNKDTWIKKSESLDEDLKTFLLSKSVSKEDVPRFQNIIYYCFSQFAQNHLLTLPIYHDLNDLSKPVDTMLSLEMNSTIFRENFDRSIEVKNPNTLELKIQPRRKEKQFNVLKATLLSDDARPKISGDQIKNIRVNVELNLKDTDGSKKWVASEDSSICYEVEPQLK